MKRIGLLIGTMKSGGAERVVSHLTRILKDCYDVHLILFEDTFMEYPCQGTLHTLDVPATDSGSLVKIGQLLKRVKRLKALIQQEKLDCVVSFMDNANFVNMLAKAPGCRKVLSIRNYPIRPEKPDLFTRGIDFMIKHLYRRADCVVTVAKLIEQVFRDRYQIPEEKLFTIYNPYNFEDICQMGALPLPNGAQAFYEGNFVFANVGRISYQKGGWHLVKAFSLVQKQYPDARLVIAGRDGSGGKLAELVRQLGIEDNVLLTGQVSNPYQYMKNADCYVLSSLFEGFPNAMVEAMACGCPIIATDCKSGPREILYENAGLDAKICRVTEADYGILVPELEEEVSWDATEITQGERQLAQAMMALMADPEKQKVFAQKAERRSHAFDYAAAREAFCRVIEGK